MRALIQRVKQAEVKVEGESTGKIGKGILILLGVGEDDTDKDISYLVEKLSNLRIFAGEKGKFDLSIKDVNGEILVVSQFTLFGNVKKGRRPDFMKAAAPEKANELYERFIKEFATTGLKVESGKFAAMMDVSLINDGPVTLMVDSNE